MNSRFVYYPLQRFSCLPGFSAGICNRFQISEEYLENLPLLKFTILYCIAGILPGILFSMSYRWHLGISLFPKSLHYFVLVAALIGCVEELVFRGFIQDYVKKINAPFSIIFSSISHTGYKCCLFLSPVVTSEINIGFLAFWTLIAGILFGTINHISKSILPSLIAHALFDILVYAEFVSAPWWVW